VVEDTDAVLDSDAGLSRCGDHDGDGRRGRPGRQGGRVQVTDTFPTWVQAQPVPVAETKVTPAGRVSATDSEAASDGPLLLTTRE
jgi:hypothetical protein